MLETPMYPMVLSTLFNMRISNNPIGADNQQERFKCMFENPQRSYAKLLIFNKR